MPSAMEPFINLFQEYFHPAERQPETTIYRLQSITDRNDNHIDLSYNTVRRSFLSTITVNANTDWQLRLSWSGSHISALMDPADKTWSYSYDASAKYLSSVITPNGQAGPLQTNYAYETSSTSPA